MKAFRYLKLSVFVILTLVAVQACTLSEYIFVTATPSELILPEPTPTSPTREIIANGQIAYIINGNVWRYILSTGEFIQVTTQNWDGRFDSSYIDLQISPNGRYLAYGKLEYPDIRYYISDLLDGSVTDISSFGEFLGWTGQGNEFFTTVSNRKYTKDDTNTGLSFYRNDFADLSSPELMAFLRGETRPPVLISNDGQWARLRIDEDCPHPECSSEKLWHLPTAKQIKPPFSITPGSIDFSPDSKTLAMTVRYGDWYKESTLFVANIDMSALTPIVTQPQTRVEFAFWSPDGQWLAFEASTTAPDYFGRVMLVRPDGSDLTRVEGEDALLAGWSPDGSKLLYWQAESTDPTLHTYEISTGLKQQLPIIVNGTFSSHPDWGNLLQW